MRNLISISLILDQIWLIPSLRVSNPQPLLMQRLSKTFFSPAMPEEITSIIHHLKSKKAARDNDVDTKFLQYSNMLISLIICDLFNSCIEPGSFPDALKVAEVVPVFKKWDSNQANNYWPISLLSQCSKILEKLVLICIYSFFEEFDLLSRCQYGSICAMLGGGGGLKF